MSLENLQSVESITLLKSVLAHLDQELSIIVLGQEKYLGFFTSQYVFRVSFVFVTTERIIIRRSRLWILSWGIGVAIGLLGPILVTLRILDTFSGFGFQIVSVIMIGFLLGRILTRRYKGLKRIETKDSDLQVTKSQVIQIEIRPIHGVHPARITITSLVGEPISLPTTSKKVYSFASRILTSFNPKAVTIVPD